LVATNRKLEIDLPKVLSNRKSSLSH